MLIAFWLIWPDAELRDDLKRRIIGLKGARPIYIFLTCFLMLASILLAQAISLLFGYSADQFNLSGMSSFSVGIFPGWFLLFLAPMVEELAWHSYGTDSLRQRMNLLKIRQSMHKNASHFRGEVCCSRLNISIVIQIQSHLLWKS